METIIHILGNIGFDWRIALANFVNFLIIFWLLKKFIFSKISQSLEKRKEVIIKGVTDAQEAETALMMAEEKKKELIRGARVEADAIVANAYTTAKKTVAASGDQAKKESERIIAEAAQKIEKQHKESEKRLEKQTAEMVVAGVRKILVEEMTPALQDKIVSRITS